MKTAHILSIAYSSSLFRRPNGQIIPPLLPIYQQTNRPFNMGGGVSIGVGHGLSGLVCTSHSARSAPARAKLDGRSILSDHCRSRRAVSSAIPRKRPLPRAATQAERGTALVRAALVPTGFPHTCTDRSSEGGAGAACGAAPGSGVLVRTCRAWLTHRDVTQ